MRRHFLTMLAVCFVATSAIATTAVRQGFEAELEIRRAILVQDLEEMARQQGEVEEAWSRVSRLGADMLRAQQEGESVESLRLRDGDLRRAEAELAMDLQEGQRLRWSITDNLSIIQEMEGFLERLGEDGEAEDPLSGTWELVVEPGGLEGELFLELNGTLVTGTYQLSGGWTGSMRGTLVAGQVRLERVDSQLGFAAVFYGSLETYGTIPRLEGMWEGTNLTAGLPSAGTWAATKSDVVPPGGTR
jgi:hypothetical protein